MPSFRGGFTTRASCLLAAGVTALACGWVLGAVDLVRAGVLALALPVASALSVYRSRVQISNRRTVEPERAEAGSPVTMHLAITNRSLLRTGSLLLEDQLPAQLAGRARFVVPGLAGHEARTVSYRMPALRRGRYRAGPLRVRLTDPFGMVDVIRSFSAASEFLVTPVAERLAAIEPPRSYDVGDNAGSHSIGVHGADDASTREYRTGDDLRKIHWRSSARAGALMVRMEERPWQGRASLLVDVRAPAHVAHTPADVHADARDSDSLEWAVSAAATIGTHLMLAGREVGLVCDRPEPQLMHFGSAGRLLDHLADVTPAHRAELTPFAVLLHAAARDSALIAVLGALDATNLQVLTEAHPRGTAIPAFAVLLDTRTWRQDADGADRTIRGSDVMAARRVLEASGWHVAIARRGDRVADVCTALLRAGRPGQVLGGSR